MMYMRFALIACMFALLGFSACAGAEEFATYTVKRVSKPVTIDGILDEPEWEHAVESSVFLLYKDGAASRMDSHVRLLWDDTNLYAAIVMSDVDVWATITTRDGKLYNEEVAEIFIDPDGDGLNYVEIEVNPLGTVMELLMNKEYAEGGKGDWAFTLNGFTAVVGVDGTVNDATDTDICWTVECAIPFTDLASTAPAMAMPPREGDTWRANFYRYERDRKGTYEPELTAWNPTGPDRGFHAPDMFGRLVFSLEPVMGAGVADNAVEPLAFSITGVYPNPFNPSAAVQFRTAVSTLFSVDVFNINGQRVRRLFAGNLAAGDHTMTWDGLSEDGLTVTSGVYLFRLTDGVHSVAAKALLLR